MSALTVVTVALVLLLAGCDQGGDADGFDEAAERRETALLLMLATKDDLRGRDGEPIANELDALMAEIDLVEAVKEDRLQDLIDHLQHNSSNVADVLRDLEAELDESPD